ncbi:hypothetical protein [Frateuria defendens]|uniref:hypothetical protein n=1 Tax=Frateuria defendens TaxID=2219559 RepID=UPI0007DC00C4|nr:hypothetical protein [Frateuria defendens]
MTITSLGFPRTFLIAAGAALLAGAPCAAMAQSSAPKPAPVAMPAAPPVHYQQVVRQQQVRDQLQKNQVEEQIRQRTSDAARRANANDPAQMQRLDQAEQAQRDLYRARQQDAVDRYWYGTTPRPAPYRATQPPAASRSGG